jgi:hypothetical protein
VSRNLLIDVLRAAPHYVDQSWKADRNCADLDPNMFFPGRARKAGAA